MAEKSRTTPRSTKDQLQKEVERLVTVVNTKQQAQLKPAEVKKAKRKKEVAVKTEGLSVDKVEAGVNTLRTRLLTSLNEVDTSLKAKVEELAVVEEQLGFKREEVEEVYGIEAKAGTLAAIIEAQQEQKEAFEVAQAAKSAAFDEAVLVARKAWDLEKAEYIRLKNVTSRQDNEVRTRTLEEQKYASERNAQTLRDALNDELAGLRKSYGDEVEVTEKALSQRTEEVEEREAKADQLETQVATLTAQLETKVAAAVEETKKNMNSAKGIAVSAVERDYNAQLTVLNGKLDSANSILESERARVLRLESDLASARAEVITVAKGALEAQSGAAALAAVQQSNAANNVSKRS